MGLVVLESDINIFMVKNLKFISLFVLLVLPWVGMAQMPAEPDEAQVEEAEVIYDYPIIFNKAKNKESFSLGQWDIMQADALPPPEIFKSFGETLEDSDNEAVFKMQEHNANYFVMGKPDTKVQFSFKFKFFKKTPVYLGYTQTMFWELFKENSNPFSELNYNPEIFYRWENVGSLIKEINFGFAHLSNGKDEEQSRSVDSLYIRLMSYAKYPFGLPAVVVDLRYLHNRDLTNKDIRDFYGPVVLKFYFNKLGQKVFHSEELFLEYYNGGDFAEDFSKSSVRVSMRFKLWDSSAAPKVFMQYFNGYGENLANYNVREESYRIGLSIGGF